MAIGSACVRHTPKGRIDYVLLKTQKDTCIKSLTFMERWALFADMQIFIDQHLRFPSSVDIATYPHGGVYLGVLIESDGRLSEVRVLEATLPAFAKEAARVVKSIPPLKPTLLGTTPTRAAVELYVQFDKSVPPEAMKLPLKGPVDCSHRYKGSVYGYPLLYGYDTTYWCCNRDLPDPIHKLDSDLGLVQLYDTDQEIMGWKPISAILDTSEETEHKIFYMSVYASKGIDARLPHTYRTVFPMQLPALHGMAGKAYLFSFRRVPKPSSPDLIGMYSLVEFDSTTKEVRDGPYLPMTLDDLDLVYRELRSAAPPPPKPITQMQFERNLCESGQELAYPTYDVQEFFQRNFRYDAKVSWENYLQVVIGGLSDTNGCLTITSVYPSGLPSCGATDSLIREIKQIAALMPPLEPARLNGKRCDDYPVFTFFLKGKPSQSYYGGFSKVIQGDFNRYSDEWRTRHAWYARKATYTLDSMFNRYDYMVYRHSRPDRLGPVRPLSILQINTGEMRVILPERHICYTSYNSLMYIPKNATGYVLITNNNHGSITYTLTPFTNWEGTIRPTSPCPLNTEGLADIAAFLDVHP